MTDAPKLQPLVDGINRRGRNDDVTNLLSDICDECDAAHSIIWGLGELVTDPEVAKRLLRVMHHVDEIERIVDLLDQSREGVRT